MPKAPQVTDRVLCWPHKHGPDNLPSNHPEEAPLVCGALVCAVHADAIVVHYFLPDGANGACELPIAAADAPEHGRWWWPPTA